MQAAQYDAIFNDGERLIPGESHDLAETVRHKSSYRFFKHVIETDVGKSPQHLHRILDLGCGVGHGAHSLSTIPGVEIVAIDPSAESIDYARVNYAAQNISYLNIDGESYLSRGESFDYIVSRHALEHVENGLELARRYDCRKRLMINVPYKEPEGNIHHKVHFIEESTFERYDGAEFFFEGLDGVTETAPEKLAFVNSIVCILTRDDSEKVGKLLDFPFAAWQPSLHERIIIETTSSLKLLQTQTTTLAETVQELAQQRLALESEVASSKVEIEASRTEIGAIRKELEAIQGTLVYRVAHKVATIVRR